MVCIWDKAVRTELGINQVIPREAQMPRIVQLITNLEILEAKVYGSANVVDYMDTARACTQLLLELTVLRDRFSLRAYVELYERAVSVEDVLNEKILRFKIQTSV